MHIQPAHIAHHTALFLIFGKFGQKIFIIKAFFVVFRFCVKNAKRTRTKCIIFFFWPGQKEPREMNKCEHTVRFWFWVSFLFWLWFVSLWPNICLWVVLICCIRKLKKSAFGGCISRYEGTSESNANFTFLSPEIPYWFLKAALMYPSLPLTSQFVCKCTFSTSDVISWEKLLL